MKLFIFRLKEGSTVDDALFELEAFFSDIYEIDDPLKGTVQIGCYCDTTELPEEFTHVILEQTSDVEEVDWQQQWSSYAPDFHHGLAHVDLSPFGGSVLQLKPGSGFGDFSHPTTRLVLALMASLVKDKPVIDIGCGSGILSLAAILLGAKRAYGIDIEDEALEHSRENAKINQIEEHLQFAKKIDPTWPIAEPCVIVMNMIETEQEVAWASASALHAKNSYVITSGILASQEEHYLQLAKKWNWVLKETKEEEGWVGFIFTQNS